MLVWIARIVIRRGWWCWYAFRLCVYGVFCVVVLPAGSPVVVGRLVIWGGVLGALLEVCVDRGRFGVGLVIVCWCGVGLAVVDLVHYVGLGGLLTVLVAFVWW